MISENYPIGGMIEPFDIEREKDLLEQVMELEDDEEQEMLADSFEEEDTEDEEFKWGEDREDEDDYSDMSGATPGER